MPAAARKGWQGSGMTVCGKEVGTNLLPSPSSCDLIELLCDGDGGRGE
jgi:hypothetical protein